MKHKTSGRILSVLLTLVMIVGMIPASALPVFAAEEPETHVVTCVTPGVKLYEYEWWNDTVLGDVTTMTVSHGGFTPTFIVEIQRGYREAEGGLEVYYESSDQPLVKASRFEYNRTHFSVSGKVGSWVDSYNGILNATTIYVTGVEEDPAGDHLYGRWTDQGDGTHKISCVDDGCDVSMVRDHIWEEEGYETVKADCEHRQEVVYECITRDCQGELTVYGNYGHTMKYIEDVSAGCGNPGTVGHWFCTECGRGFADEAGTVEVAFADTVVPPAAHTEGCGHTGEESKFVYDEDYTYSSSYSGTRGLILGKVGEQYYAMGNVTNEDGSRNAVKVEMGANGIITANSLEAEFLTFNWDSTNGLMADGGYLAVDGGKVLCYAPERYKSGSFVPKSLSMMSSRSDGFGYMYSYNGIDHIDHYLIFDPENLKFVASDTHTDSIVLYREVCKHKSLKYTPATPATCTEQGSREFWYCEDDNCWNYYTDGNLEVPVDVSNEAVFFTIPATGHKFTDGNCEYCGMPRPVYKQVESLEQFEAMSKDAQYIIVVKDGEKAYAMAQPPINRYYDDNNSNEEFDIFEIDENANDIPDCIEGIDINENGIEDILEDWDYNEVPGERHDYYCIYFELADNYDTVHANDPNCVEVTMAGDGSVTLGDEGAAEFQLMESGVWGGQEYQPDVFEYENIKENERMRAAWIPNYWIGFSHLGYMAEGHLMLQNRVYDDGWAPGIIDHKNWKFGFNPDGTANIFNTWEDFYDDEALQLVKYTDADGNPRMTFFSVTEWLRTDSTIAQNATEFLPVYLYAFDYEKPHVCTWGPWIEDAEARTHTRTCTDTSCGLTETQPHNWDEGVVTKTATCEEEGTILYTCPDCSATREEVVPANEHQWGPWIYDNADSHVRFCDNCKFGAEYEDHEWADWTVTDETYHSKECSICHYAASGEHQWDTGVITKGPTDREEGETTYTCTVCGHTKTEIIPMIPHEHTWEDWRPENDEVHVRTCLDPLCGEREEVPHQWDSGEVIQAPSCGVPGQAHYTCTVCGYVDEFREIPALVHEWSEWSDAGNGKHQRTCANPFCIIGTESEEHTFVDGICTKCGAKYVEPVRISAPAVKGSNVESSGKIKLTWNKVDGAVKYQVYRALSRNGKYGIIKAVSDATSYVNENAEAGKRYYYYVVAVAQDGTKSEKSNIVDRTCDLARPAKVTLSNVEASGKVKVSWTAVAGAKEYKIYRANKSNGEFILQKTTAALTWTDGNSKAGNTYFYRVVAVHKTSSANSAPTARKSRLTDLPRPATVTLTNVASTGKIKVSWTKVNGAVKYQVYRATTKNGEYTPKRIVTGTSWTDTSVTAGKTYYYKVKAIHSNANANSALTSYRSRMADLKAPIVKITTSSGKPKVSWAAVTGAKEYKIYRATSKTGKCSPVKTTTAKYWKDTTAKKGKTYYYKVVAVHKNSSANSAYSNVVYKKCTR